MQPQTDNEKNRQIRREALLSLGLYLAFFVWWYVTGYGIAETGTPETYTYLFGLPLWFLLSCIVGYLLFCVATIFTVRRFFKDIDLGTEETK